MKKILLLLCAAVSINAYAQKDIAVSIVQPTAGTTLTGGQSFNLVIGINNAGATEISTTDSVIIGLTLDGTLLQNGDGQNLIFLYKPSQAIPAGATVNISVTGGVTAVLPTSSNANLCVLGLLRNGVDIDNNSTNDLGCVSVNTVSGTSTGIGNSNFNFAEITAYPIPTNDVLTVQHNLTNTNGKINIFNLTGKQVATYALTNESNKIHVSAFDAGIYFYQVISNGILLKSSKFIVTK